MEGVPTSIESPHKPKPGKQHCALNARIAKEDEARRYCQAGGQDACETEK